MKRPRSLTVHAQDRFGKSFQINAKDFFARIILHEMDHLDGIVYLDRMEGFSTLTHHQGSEQF